MKEAVVTIRRKDSDKFEGQSKGIIGWFNIDHGFFRRQFSTLEPDFYLKIQENDIEGQDMEPYRKFILPFDYTNLNLININYPVKNRVPSIDKGKKTKEIFVAPICGNITLPTESINIKKVTNGPNLITKS